MTRKSDPCGYPRLLPGAALIALCLGSACSFSAKAEQQVFKTPEDAAEALITAAEKFDVEALKGILGPSGVDLVVTEDPVLDRKQAAAFAAEARKGLKVVRDSADVKVAHMAVGPEEWPVPIPVVEEGGSWKFDTVAGREEILLRRIGRNEFNAIEICRGYVEAQYEYASEKRDGATVNQYAQRIVSTPGKQDGLAWQLPDGTWEGPVGEGIARVIADGYTSRLEPYNGYYYKILKGQGPAAPMGEMDFLVKGVMIGGFAMVAAPADYEVTGVMTFIVSHDGIVYQKDLGPKTLDEFRAMERYNPDPSWQAVEEPLEEPGGASSE